MTSFKLGPYGPQIMLARSAIRIASRTSARSLASSAEAPVGISFNLDDDQRGLRDTARRFAREVMAPKAAECAHAAPGASHTRLPSVCRTRGLWA